MSQLPHESVRAPRFGALLFSLLAIGLASATVFVVMRMLKAGGYANGPVVSVVVATKTLEAGRALSADDLALISWPASSVPAGAFNTIESLLEPRPRVIAGGFVRGEPFLPERLAAPGTGPGLAALVAAESRAIALQLDKAVVGTRLFYPGARVDVIATLSRGQDEQAQRVAEDARVLAVGSLTDIESSQRAAAGQVSAKSSDGDETVVTVEIPLKDAERVSSAARLGKVDLVLRNPTDRGRGALAAPVVDPRELAELAKFAVETRPVPAKSTSKKKKRERARDEADEAPRKIEINYE